MDEWFRVVAANVWRYLDGVAGVDQARAPTLADVRKLSAAWRALLRLHDGGSGGGCARCRRGHAGSCTVWQVAIGYFVRRSP